MNEYRKILISTFAGSLVVASAISLGFIIEGNIKGFLYFFILSSFVGFFCYGVIGSTAWWLAYKYIFKMDRKFKSHKWSSFAVAFILSVFLVLSAQFGYIRSGEVVVGVVVSIIGAGVSVLCFWLLFHRCNKNA
jgi:hypothetical protein